MSDVLVEVTSAPVSVTVSGDDITVDVTSTPVTVEVGQSGPQGPPGPAGTTGSFEYTQSTPLATWTIPIPGTFSRRPNITLYLSSGESVIADVSSTTTTATVTFASPVSGSAVLS